MTATVQTDILESLQTLHGDVQRRFAELDRYRALQAIERTIADFPDLDDVAHSLGDIRDRVQAQLDGTPEFRALRSIERMLPELSDVLMLLNGTSNSEEISDPGEATLASESPVPESVVIAEAVVVAQDALPAGDLDAATQSPSEAVAVDIETVATAAEPEQPQDLPQTDVDAAHVTTVNRTAFATTDDRHPPGPEIDARGSEPVHVPSLADSVAQLMAQAAMPPRDPPAPSDWGTGTDAPERPQSPAERAA